MESSNHKEQNRQDEKDIGIDNRIGCRASDTGTDVRRMVPAKEHPAEISSGTDSCPKGVWQLC
jgi:hypothetical protein